MELESGSNNGENAAKHPFLEDIDSTSSTPYVSAPSSPGREPIAAAAFFYSAPASPMHFAITATFPHSSSSSVTLPCDFEFSARFDSTGSDEPSSMSSADELFYNGQIRPMKLSTHLEEKEEESRVRGRDLRLRDNKSERRRRTRSSSPLRNTRLERSEEGDSMEEVGLEKTPSVSASSSSGRSSKKWVLLKDFLRSKSEGRSNNNKFWSTISFTPTKEKKPVDPNHGNGSSEMQKSMGNSQAFSKKVTSDNGVGKRRVAAASAHELHYKAKRAQAEELRKKTYLPYRQGLFGCLGFSSKGYGAVTVSGFATALNPVSSR